MKNLILLLCLTFIGYAAAGQAIPNRIHNQTNCTIRVTKDCYDICVLVSSTSITVAPGATIQMTAIPLVATNSTALFTGLCWVLDEHCEKDPIVPCVSVDGSPLVSSPCNIGSYTGTLQAGCPEFSIWRNC